MEDDAEDAGTVRTLAEPDDDPVADEEGAGEREQMAEDGESDVAEELDEDTESRSGTDEPGRRLWQPRFGARALGWLRSIRLPRGRKGRVLLTVVVLMVAGGGTGGYFWWNAGRLPDGVAFRVGDQNVSVDQLNAEADKLRLFFGVQPPSDPAKAGDFRRTMAKAYAVQLILEQQVRQQGIVIADKTAQDALTGYISQQVGDGADARDTFLKQLAAAGTSEQAVLDQIKDMLAVNALFSRQTRGISVSDQEVRQAFDQRRASLATPEKRDIKNIVVSTQDQANQVLTQLAGGAVFEDVARTSSLDDQTRGAGGDLGQVAASQLDDTYAKAAFAAPPNGVFGPVQTQYGWNIGKVASITPAVPAEFDSVQAQVKQQLIDEQASGRWRDWLGQRIREAAVQYADDYRPADPDSPPPTAATGQPEPAGQPGS
ncbi:peptidylprolyl isomerase [Amycolatopsis acidiphila]|uniref:Parvulin peptidyl-prolyl isomerase n=1 Tax=Amycolatopsis acidiphila TaxID=715473 RepID=A0A557ZZX4_9PSEU|nr:peptidyl-prolyl cis-trans isomerase [Amycolatopsis acidiphila]TVT17541.1 parvulin peptidyl-prolyl isomerase [Amycolatopsis acidiphila]UIJ57676.1 peptidylprolyl isomerase [Amycolatopsis acidiphila]GHG95409.1 hypothetical protein GCM10017788_73810 [Amycolatopsis acidiphila]